MIAFQKLTLAAVAFATGGLFGSATPADQPGPPGPGQVQKGEIRGRITFPRSMLSPGDESAICGHFSVLAESSGGSTTSGTMSENMLKTKGSTVTCYYTITNLAASPYTVAPQGHPQGFAGCAAFHPATRSVSVPVRFGTAPVVSHVNFKYAYDKAKACARPPRPA
jgi:hypothetical protein